MSVPCMVDSDGQLVSIAFGEACVHASALRVLLRRMWTAAAQRCEGLHVRRNRPWLLDRRTHGTLCLAGEPVCTAIQVVFLDTELAHERFYVAFVPVGTTSGPFERDGPPVSVTCTGK